MKKRNNRVQFRPPVEEVIDSIERWGKTIDTAVDLALEELKANREEVEVEVLEEPSTGFFGIGAKLAKVKVTRKSPTVTEEPKKAKKDRGPIRKEEVTEEELKFDNGAGRNSGGKPKRDRGGKKPRNEKREEPALEEPVMPVVDKESLEELTDHAGLDFLKNLIEKMGLEATVEGRTDGKDLFFFVEGKDTGTIIGKRGVTLDAIQYLTSLVVNKSGEEYIRVVVDAENYRAKREKSLEKLAVRLADKVARTKRSYKLEPMNPYERKVIHATLQKDSRIVTRSEGQDPSRRVIIEVKQ